MTRIPTLLLVTAALVCAALPAPARPLYHETVTITLDDGTIVNLILDDKGMPKPPPRNTMPKRINWPRQKMLEFEAKRAPFETVVAKREMNAIPPRTVMGAILRAQAKKTNAPVTRLEREPLITPQLRSHPKVYLWPMAAQIPNKHYYYLPPSPHVAKDEKGRPQFLFVKFTTEKSTEEGGVSGGIIHFLCEYGLSAAQEEELKQKLRKKVPGSVVMGALPMELGSEENSFRVISATLTDDGFTRSLISSGKAPIMPGMKVAVAARLDARGAVLLEETLKKPTSDLSVEFNLAYTAFLPAFDGTISVEWSKVKSSYDHYSLEYQKYSSYRWKRFLWWKHLKKTGDNYRYEELHDIYDFMCEQELVNIEWTEEIVDERVNMIREAFMKIFTNMFFNRESEEMDFAEAADESDDDEKTDWKDKAKGRTFKIDTYTMKDSQQFRDVKYHLRTNLPVKVPYSAVGNISGDWYRRLKRENPDCFAEVNLDDPFFQHRRVIFGLDLDAVDMFGEIVNHCTVEVRKKRRTGRDFHDSLTFNKKYVESKGVSGTITYAKMREEDPGAFEWKAQWNMRGGKKFPKSPQWQKGDWEGITLTPPVAPMLIEAGADLSEMAELGFSGVTVKLKYKQYGRTYNDPTSMRLYVSKGEAMDEHRIFVDRDRMEYDYQVTFSHKKEGRMPQGWVRGTSDGYIYCVIPDDLRRRMLKKIKEKVEDTLGG